MNFKHSLLATSALLAATLAGAPAFAQTAEPGNTIDELVVTAERREQSLQDVPVAISAFTSEKRDLIGITSVFDLTNFTPGMQYSTQTDRVSLRGIGRTNNVHAADASVSVYSDGVYTTSTVEAGKTPLFLDRIEVLRGPQATLYGRNAVAGAINLVSKRPTDDWYAEVRAQYQNYNHFLLEGAASGPTPIEGVTFRVVANWEKQTKGWYDNIATGFPDEGNIINTNIVEGQLKFDYENWDGWMKLSWIEWRNGGGGPGSRGTWTPSPYPVSEQLFSTAITLNPGFACSGSPFVSQVNNASPAGCTNPAVTNPRKIASTVPYDVDLNGTFIFASEWTYHFEGMDLRYQLGGVHYHYYLQGPTPADQTAPIYSYVNASPLSGGLVVRPRYAFNYQEEESWVSNELTLISTKEGPLQWLAGLYYWKESYSQPVYTYLVDEPRAQGPLGLPTVFCARRGNFCAPNPKQRIFDTNPEGDIYSKAAYAQIDYKFAETFTFTAGLRYSADKKKFREQGRLFCYLVAACFAAPEVNGAVAGGIPIVDLTELQWASGAILPPGVLTPTVFDPVSGFATRFLGNTWREVTGNVTLKWDPDPDTNVYARYSHGYKPGGFRIGIDVGFSPFPQTNKETVESYEIGVKKNIGSTVQANVAAFLYDYKNAQIPLSVINTAGGVSVSQAIFYNVPKAENFGVELEGIWQPIDNLQILFNYSYLDAHITKGSAVDPADPAALNSKADPITNRASCTATVYGDTTGTCAADVFTSPRPVVNATGATTATSATPSAAGGFQLVQNLKGNDLPNAPRHKIALNANYTYDIPEGGQVIGSLTYTWRDAQYGSIFNRSYYKSPSWDQVDARVTWRAKDDHTTVIAFVRNLFDDVGYEGGAGAARRAGVNYGLGTPNSNRVEGIATTYPLTPPRTYGIEVQYKFF